MDNPFPYGPFYSPTLSKLNEGACVLVHFTLNRDAAENSSTVVRSRGYSTVTISAQAEVEKYRIARFSDPGAPDTGKVLKDEVPIKNPVNRVRGYVRGYLFVEHVLNQPSDQRNEWYLTYNPDAKAQTYLGKHTYDIYLRTTKRTAGTKTAVDMRLFHQELLRGDRPQGEKQRQQRSLLRTLQLRLRFPKRQASLVKNRTSNAGPDF